jgi:Phage tail sheath C-terminal domain
MFLQSSININNILKDAIMALVSPGVEVTVIDESNYIPAATNSVPYILIATAQNKISGTGAGVAPGTLAVNAGKVYLVTSQRNLAATFGNPFFYKTSAGTPINGYELNEYGLLAAFSVLGISNRAYIQRADIDLAALTASLVRPTGAPNDGDYWLDTADTKWGIFQWNATTGAFTAQTPIVITSSTQVTGSVPNADVGSIGNYAVVATNSNNPVYYKNSMNEWVLVGSDDWKTSWPTIQGTTSVTDMLTAGNTIIINGTTVTVPTNPNNTVNGLATAINNASIAGVTAEVDSSSRLVIYANSEAESDDSTGDGGIVNIDISSTAGLLTALGITAGIYHNPALQQSPNYTNPRWRSTDTEPRPTGSVWNMLTNVNGGANIVVKQYSAILGAFVTQSTPIYENDQSANKALDPAGGGKNIPAGTLYVEYNTEPQLNGYGGYNNTQTLKVYDRFVSGPTTITGDTTDPTFTPGDTFTISASSANSSTLTTPVEVEIGGTGTAADFVAAVSSAGVTNVSATVTSDGAIAFTHALGGVIVLTDTGGTPVADAGFNTGIEGVRDATGTLTGGLILSAWVPLAEQNYIASNTTPSQDPADGRYWYYSATNQVDIMIQSGTSWQGYKNVTVDSRGYNLTQTNPTGPIISATAPTVQTDGTDLVFGDLWVDTSNLELYPMLNRWELVNDVAQWVEISNTDQTTSNGILFADARWATNGTTNPITDNIPTITSLLTSDYLDLDAPDATLYPAGTLLWNTRRSGFNVKTFQSNYFNGTTFAIDGYSNATTYAVNDLVLYEGIPYIAIAPGSGNLPTNTSYWSPLQTNAWVTASGNRADGSPYMGRLAQRQLVVSAMKSAIDTQDTLREEQNVFNLIASPNYPELIPNMIRLNNERSNTAFIVGDTPLRLPPEGTAIVDWSTDAGGLGYPSGDGLTTSDAYVGVFYPSCQTTDLTGSIVVQPPSHMMLRTIVRSDEVAYPWLAPAGVRRGVIDNADRIGYVNAATGEFITIATGQGLRDVLYTNKINPITFIPGVGITNYGNKTESSVTSALDRINVARLVAFIRGRLNEIGKTFVFEPNDQITRNEITNAIDGLMIDLVAKRGIYDYLIVCDLSNNTPARIDRNELYVDIAIEPVKAVEFIYIPVRIKNTGELAAGQTASSATV